MKRFLCMLLILALFAPAALADASAKLEGPGYDTPEAAVLAYLDGLNAGDAQAMLATFAYETFADHANPRVYLERIQSFLYSYSNGLPMAGDYARSLVITLRYGKLASALAYQYIELSAHLQGNIEKLPDSAAVDALLEKFDQSPVNDWQGRVEFVKWLSPAAVSDKYVLPANTMNIALQTEYAGADDVTELAAHVRLNGVDAVQSMQCVKYGDRWYNLEITSVLSAILGLDSMSAGMFYPADEEQRTALKAALTASADPASLLLLSGCAASTLAGTRWQLVSVSGADAAVAGSAEDAAAGTSTVYGEVHFLRVGGAILNLRFSPDLAKSLGADGGRAKVTLAWANALGTLMIRDARTRDMNLDVSNMLITRRGNDLILTLQNGIEATFARKGE